MALDWLFGEPEILWRHTPSGGDIRPRNRFFRPLEQRRTTSGRQKRLAARAPWPSRLAAGSRGLISLGGPIALPCPGDPAGGTPLDEHIRAVATALDSGIEPARQAVGMIVGRDTSELEADDIARAAIETGAENLSDGVIAPAMWFVAAGLPGVIIYKLVNTADSMIGYRNARHLHSMRGGTADDLLNFIPARVTALLICLAATLRGRGCWRSRHDP